MFFRSVRFRLTLWYVVLLAVILAVFSAGVYLALRRSLYDNLDESIENRADVLLPVVSYEDGRPTFDDAAVPGDPEGEQFARVFDSSGAVTFDNSAASDTAPIDDGAVAAALAGRTTTHRIDAGGQALRVRTAPITRGSEIVGALEVALSEEDVRETLRILLLVIAVAYPLTLVVASAGGVFLAGRALSPIDRLTRLARTMTAQDLSRRLELNLPDDEVGRLARTFDEMIARLDDAFRRQRQFTADASHELRTPLTAVKGQTEVALQRERDAREYREVLNSINGEVDRMIRIIGSLLTLARADAGQIPLVREPVDLSAVVDGAVDHIRPAAAAKGVGVRLDGAPDIKIPADEDLLLQLWLNLLDNAVKYTAAGGEVTVRWDLDGQHAAVRVSDTGIGIPPEHLPHIFDRFYRIDPARSRAEGGAGLGLSISRWIAEAHGGTIDAESSSTAGSTFTVRLPLS